MYSGRGVSFDIDITEHLCYHSLVEIQFAQEARGKSPLEVDDPWHPIRVLSGQSPRGIL